eukprot:56953-Chlamydomonas_euryale.AAC.5
MDGAGHERGCSHQQLSLSVPLLHHLVGTCIQTLAYRRWDRHTDVAEESEDCHTVQRSSIVQASSNLSADR